MSERSRRWRRRASAATLVRRATADGERAARSGQYDEWSFGTDATVSYLVRLECEADRLVAEERARLSAELQRIDRGEEDAAERRSTAGIRAEAAVDVARDRMERHRKQRDGSRAQLDLLTGVHEPVPPGHVVGDGHAGDRHPLEGAPSAEAPRARWIGPANGALAPPVPHWLRLPLVLLLAAVEVPVYFAIFRVFHPRDPAMTWCFTLPVALSMVLGPHLTGVWMRRRLARPSTGRLPLVGAAALMVAWAGAALLLAAMRGSSLVAPTVVNGVTVQSTVRGFSESTLTAVFALLILLSGLIAFMLGLAEDHPGVAAFSAAASKATKAERDYLAAVNEHAGARREVVTPRSDPKDTARERSGYLIEAIRAEHRAARAAYLDAVSTITGNPSMTHAAAAVADSGAAPPDPAATGAAAPGRPAGPGPRPS